MIRRNGTRIGWLVVLASAVCLSCSSTLSAADCNTNGIEDSDDIAMGTSEDCNSNGIPDECDIAGVAHTYSVDSGMLALFGGFPSSPGGSWAWLNHLTILDDSEIVDGIELVWGLVTPGTPATVYLWDDPNGDGDPSDAQVIAWADAFAEEPATGSFVPVDLPDTYVGPVGTSFFAGCVVPFHPDYEQPAAGDDGTSPGQSWLAGDFSPLDPNNLGIATYPLMTTESFYGSTTNWLLRAVALEGEDCNTNNIPDECDVPPIGNGPDCNIDGVPDECQLDANDCNTDGVPDDCQLVGNDCNANGVPDECEPDEDCNTNGVQDICDIAGPTSNDCQPDGVPDECQLSGNDCNTNSVPDECEPNEDCNTNGVQDICDIARPTSSDCQPDGVPDECQLSGNDCNSNGVPDECEWLDCNANGTLDACDILGGTSADCQPDGVPDECQLSGNDCDTNGVPDECDPYEDCNSNAVQDICDIAGPTSNDCQLDGVPDDCQLVGNDCNINGVPDECEPDEDCNSNGVQDICDIAGPTSSDCQPDGVPDDCQLVGNDCNSNGVPDECEPDEDCNTNGVQDICDIAGTTSDDCNNDDVPDECQLFENDCNTNGVPDDCEVPTPTTLFAADVRYAVGSSTDSVATGDLDRDGDVDLVVAAGSVSVRLNNGDGTFGEQTMYCSGCDAISVALGDLDADGDPDLVLAKGQVNKIAILRNHGDGTFADEVQYDVGQIPPSVAVRDLDDDGDLDLAVAAGDDVVVLFNQGDGTFPAQVHYVVAPLGLQSLAIGDLDGDGDPDLAAVGAGADVFVLLNDGDGTFAAQVSAYACTYMPSVAAGDVDDDGDLDLVASCLAGQNVVVVLFNNGDGIFPQIDMEFYYGFDWPYSVTLGDLDGDSDLDLAVANWGRDDVSVLLNNSDGTFAAEVPYDVGNMPVYVLAGDLDGHGNLDLAVANSDSRDVSVLLHRYRDCNGNGIPDECDLTAGTGGDCNSNSIPDECEIAASFHPTATWAAKDCNGNTVLDECDITAGTSTDCNTNGAPDACDVAYAPSVPDVNGDLIPDECQVVNLMQGTAHATIPAAIAYSVTGDELLAAAQRFTEDVAIDFNDKAITLRSRHDVPQPDGASMVLADDSTLAAAAGYAVTLGGSLVLEVGDRADVVGDQIVVGGSGELHARTASILYLTADSGAQVSGAMQVDPLATLAFSSALSNSGLVSIHGGTIDAPDIGNTGTVTGYGALVAVMTTNDNDFVVIADTQVIGDYINNGSTTIQDGTLTILGTLTNNGEIIGDFSGGARGGDDGFFVDGDYLAGSAASLLMPSGGAAVRIGGDYDVAIDSNQRYDMALAELRMVGLAGTTQNLEVMSEDVGPYLIGLDRTQPGHYPVGTLRIGPTPTTVDIVDNHDSDGLGQTTCEAVYVQELIIESGATLLTNGCPVYYVSLTLGGTVDDPNNLVAILPVPGDADGDGDVDLDDYAVFSDCLNGPDSWPNPTPPTTPQDCLDAFNFNGDEDVDLADFAEFQEAFSG